MKAFFFREFEAFGCSLDAGGGAGPEVCSGRDGRDSWAGQLGVANCEVHAYENSRPRTHNSY